MADYALKLNETAPSDTSAAGNGPVVPANAEADHGAADAPAPTSVGDAPVRQDQPHPLDVGPAAPALQPRLDLVGKIADPRLRNRVEANVRLGTQRQVAAFTDQQRDLKAQAKAIIDQGGDLDSIPAKLMLGIDLPGRDALHAYAMTHANPTTDPATYYGLKTAALDDPAGFQGIDLGNHMARLNAKDYGDLQQLQSDLRNGQPPADFSLQQAYKANTDRLLQQLGLPTDLTSSSSSAANDNLFGQRQAALIRQAVDQHVAATEIATGHKMTPDDHFDLLQQSSSIKQSQASIPEISQSPLIAGSAAAMSLPMSMTGGTPAGSGSIVPKAITLAPEIAPAGAAGAAEAAAEGGAAAGLGPLAFLTAGILALTSSSTASPALDEMPSALGPLPTATPKNMPAQTPNTVDRSENSGGPQGASLNESEKKKFRQKKEAAKAKASNTPATPSAMPPSQREPDNNDDEKPPTFKKPSRDLKVGDRIDLKKFTDKIKGEAKFRDPDSDYTIEKDETAHGGSRWKLKDRFGKPIGSFSPEGRFLRPPSGGK